MEDGDSDNQHMYESNGVQEDIGMAEKESNARKKKLATALQNNQELTSLDLSSNSISLRGAEAIAKALEEGGAPQLILLNLRENPLGPEAAQLLESLKQTRRQLKVDLSNGEVATPSSGMAADPDGHEMLEVKAAPKKEWDWLNWVDDRGSKAAANGGAWSEDGHSDERASAACWEQISNSLAEQPVDVRAVSTDLRICSMGIRKEMIEAKAPLLPRTKLDQLRPFTHATVKNLSKLAAILDLSGRPHVTPYSKATPIAVAGVHCALVAQIVEQLLSALCASINVHILKAELLPRLAFMAFEFPKNNVIHSAVCKAIRWALQSGLSLLWEPLLKPRMGLAKGSHLRKGNIVERLLAALRRGGKAETVGGRDCDVGLACSIADSLLSAAKNDAHLHQCLKDAKGGEELMAEDSILQPFLAEQKDDLCGPRPQKTFLRPQAAELAEEAPQPNFSPGPQSSALMQLLQQSFEGSHIQEPSDVEGQDDDSDEELQEID